MKVNDCKEARPLLLKLGVALTLTFAGFIYSHLRSKRLSSSPSSGDGEAGLECEVDAQKTKYNEASLSPSENYEEASSLTLDTDSPALGLSSSSKQTREDEELTLLGFDQLVLKDFEFPTNINTTTSPRKDVAQLTLKRTLDKEAHQTIINLRNKVRSLHDREKKLERELLGYYGLKEQQTAFMELQNRLKISSVEAKLFNLKIESLQADNRRMEAQVADYSRVVAELESAKAKIKLLKRKIRTDEEQNKEQLSSLQQILKSMEDKETDYNTDARIKLHRLKELENESVELRRANSILQLENSEIARKLESTQILASSVLEVPEAEALQEANHQLRQENESLMQEIERLQENRCADVEELVYLRWLNACLRYELKDFQSSPGKTIARDLNKSVSPRSKEKAKQLILEYANVEETNDNGASLMDIDFEYWSSSQNSNQTDWSLDDSSEIPSTPSSTGKKFYSKLKKLVLRKNNNHHSNTLSPDRNSNMSVTSVMGLDVQIDKQVNQSSSPSQASRSSLDIQRLRNIRVGDIREEESVVRNSDVGSNYEYKKLVQHYNLHDQEQDTPERQKVRKLAEVLKNSRNSKLQHEINFI